MGGAFTRRISDQPVFDIDGRDEGRACSAGLQHHHEMLRGCRFRYRLQDEHEQRCSNGSDTHRRCAPALGGIFTSSARPARFPCRHAAVSANWPKV